MGTKLKEVTINMYMVRVRLSNIKRFISHLKLQSTSAENQLVGKTTSLTNVFSK